MSRMERVPSNEGAKKESVVDGFRSLGADRFGLEFVKKNMHKVTKEEATVLLGELKNVRPVGNETAKLQGEVMNDLQGIVSGEREGKARQVPVMKSGERRARRVKDEGRIKAAVKDIDEMEPVSGDDWEQSFVRGAKEERATRGKKRGAKEADIPSWAKDAREGVRGPGWESVQQNKAKIFSLEEEAEIKKRLDEEEEKKIKKKPFWKFWRK